MDLRSSAYDTENVFAAQELFHSRGWTDGLPVAPPTEAAVRACLSSALAPRDESSSSARRRRLSGVCGSSCAISGGAVQVPMTTIVGVDFSGHRDDRNTWVALGRLAAGGALRLDSVQPARRSDLHDLLATIPTPAVAALDFPFGVPAGFAAQLAPKYPPRTMPALWRIVSGIPAADFLAARDRFVADNGEPRRSGDARHFPESYSPLHRVNPNMVPMTYEGIRLLHGWREDYAQRWHVPPLKPPAPPARTVTLLELMPGAFLKAVGLPCKGYKKGRRSSELRETITDALATASGIRLPNLESVRMGCHASDDFLDAVIAAVGAACWVQDSERFRHPQPDELALARLEGWIYVPYPGSR